MNIKVILYVLMIPISIWVLDSLNLNNMIKKAKIMEAKILYLFLSFSLSYLVVNFLYDFYINFKIF